MHEEQLLAYRGLVVYVVDDDAGMRKALERLFRQQGLTVRSFAAAKELLDDIDYNSLGCLVLDIVMPGISGLELHQTLNARGIDLPTIFLTGRADVASAVRAFKQGAVEFIEKPFDNKALVAAVHSALKRLLQNLANRRERLGVAALLQKLTQREHEVLEEIVNGLSSKAIAKKLDISPRTIETHRENIMRKMEAASVTDLVRKVVAASAGR